MEKGKEFQPDDLLIWFDSLIPARGKGLDLGSGTGKNSLYLASKGLEVQAVDLSRKALNLLKEEAKELGLPVKTIRQDICQFPIPPSSFDLILCLGSLMFLDPDRIALLSLKIVEGLVPGGLLFCSAFTTQDPSFFSAERILKKISDRLFEGKDGRHLYFFAPGELESYFDGLQAVFYAEGHSLDLKHSLSHRHGWASLVARKT
ncbi:MAG: class I SAM-dependent methyltransferase [Caldiserica bacterium]|jgi:SAM-dependent methyltransferase|nr:class I SAM-dependent methyltransferase [Caldisericota bacterium]MDH7562912.1 class I SAM-dependent methyltransferase [Caldisericota bacterium]